MRRRSLSRMLLLVFAALLSLPAAAGAQGQPQVTLSIQAGYDGAYRIGEWFPVVADVGNDGADMRATLEWSFPGQFGEQVFRRAIDLPRGSRKRVTLEVFARSVARNGHMRLLDGDTELQVQDVSLDSIDESAFLIGVVSSDPAMLNSLSSQQVAGFSGTTVRHLEASRLPDHMATLRALNALFLHDLDSAALSPAQREALGLWVSLGGQLVVSGGASAQRSTAGLLDLLPVQIGGALSQGDITPLTAQTNTTTAPPNTAVPLVQAQPRAGAEPLPPGANLLYRWRYGAGLVTFSAFDFASLRGWIGEGSLWKSMLTQQATLAPGYNARLGQSSLLERGVLRLRSLEPPPTGVILAFLLVYVLVIGPINYLVLRRLRRLEWAWLSVPLVVLLFSCGLYAVGFGLRGGASQLNQATVVQGTEGQPHAFATGFIGLFSPRRTTYTVGFPAEALVSGAPGRFTTSDQFEPIVADESGARSLSVLADIASITTFVAEQELELPVAVQSSLVGDSSGLHGELRNMGSVALDDALLVRGDSFARLGRLAPGASAQVAANSLQPGFPSLVSLGTIGPFDRQEMLSALFDPDLLRLRNPSLPNAGLNNDQAIYLLGWAQNTTVPVTLDGRETEQTGLTLYVITLKPSTSQ